MPACPTQNRVTAEIQALAWAERLIQQGRRFSRDPVRWATWLGTQPVPEILRSARDAQGRSVLHRLCASDWRCTGTLVVTAVSEMLKRGCDPNAPDEHGYTPVWVAARSGHPVLIDQLIAFGGRASLPPEAPSSVGHALLAAILQPARPHDPEILWVLPAPTQPGDYAQRFGADAWDRPDDGGRTAFQDLVRGIQNGTIPFDPSHPRPAPADRFRARLWSALEAEKWAATLRPAPESPPQRRL